MTISRRNLLRTGAATGAALGLAGCGQGSVGGVTTKRSDTLSILSKDVQAVRNFNIFSPSNHAGPSAGLIYEQIVRQDTLDGARIKPWLASAWEFSDGGRSLTFTVRPGVRFSDGHPMTVDDFVYSMELPPKHSELNSSGVGYTGVEKVGADRVRLTFDQPAYQNLPNCVKIQIVPRHRWQGHDPVTWTNPDPVGTGPCTLAGFSTQQYLFQRRPGYWAGSLPMKYVRFPSASEDSAKLMLIGGQLDLSTIAWPGGQKHFVDRDPEKFFYHPKPGGGSEGIVFNHTKLPWSDAHVRRALSMAIDRRTVSTVLADWQAPMPVTNLDDTIYRDWLLPEYRGRVQPIDVAGARRELAQGGWRVERGNLVKDGRHYPLVFRFITDFPAWHVETAVVADQWRRGLGLNVHLTAQPNATFNAQVNSGNFDVAYWFCGNGNGVYQSYYTLIDPALAVPIGKVASGNPGRWRDPRTRELLATMRGTDDADTLRSAGHALQRIVVEQVPFIPVLAGGIWNAINRSYWKGWPIEARSTLTVADSAPALVRMLQRLRGA